MDILPRNMVSNADRQRLIDAFENGDDYMALADQLQVNRETARSIVRVWMDEGRSRSLQCGGARNVKVV